VQAVVVLVVLWVPLDADRKVVPLDLDRFYGPVSGKADRLFIALVEAASRYRSTRAAGPVPSLPGPGRP
jgi:hypothetical protein